MASAVNPQSEHEEHQPWMSKVRTYGMNLRDAPETIRGNEQIVLAAIRQSVKAIKFAPPLLQNDKNFVLQVIQENGYVVDFLSDALQNDNDIATAAAQQYDSSHIFDPQDREEYEYWMSRVKNNGDDLKDAPEHIRKDKKIVLAAVQCPHPYRRGALQFASADLQSDKQIVLAAVQRDGFQLSHATPEMQKDREVVLAAMAQTSVFGLTFVSNELRDDKDFIMDAVRVNEKALGDASSRLQNDKDVALIAAQNGEAMQYASSHMKMDKEVVLAAVRQNPDNIKFVHESMKRDPDVLRAAGMFDEHHIDPIHRKKKNLKRIVLSTRFSLNSRTYMRSQATIFTKLLKQHMYIQTGGFSVYAPNAFDKKTCDPNWTDYNHPCRGTTDTCNYQNILSETGNPTDDCCWRYSFRHQLEEAKDTGGFMLQLVERKHSWDNPALALLGDGQRIEQEMAQELGIKIFHVYRAVNGDPWKEAMDFESHHMDQVATAVLKWYDDGCLDMSLCTIRPNPIAK